MLCAAVGAEYMVLYRLGMLQGNGLDNWKMAVKCTSRSGRVRSPCTPGPITVCFTDERARWREQRRPFIQVSGVTQPRREPDL